MEGMAVEKCGRECVGGGGVQGGVRGNQAQGERVDVGFEKKRTPLEVEVAGVLKCHAQKISLTSHNSSDKFPRSHFFSFALGNLSLRPRERSSTNQQ